MIDPRGRFVVFTTQRSGSTWVMSVLNSIDGVTAQGELFLPRPRTTERRWDSGFSRPRYVESRAQLGGVRPVTVFRYLDRFYDAPGFVGFKLMYSQVRSFPEILAYLRRNRVHAIHLVRRNHLDVLISFAVKREIGLAHVLSPADRPKEVMVDIDTASLVKELRRLRFKQDVGRRVLRLCGLRRIEVAYEDLVADPTQFEHALRFLGIPTDGSVPQSHILKSRVGSQSQVVRNYDQVRATLRGSEFASLLD